MTKKEALLLIQTKSCNHISLCSNCIVEDSYATYACEVAVRQILMDRLIKGEVLEVKLTPEEKDKFLQIYNRQAELKRELT